MPLEVFRLRYSTGVFEVVITAEDLEYPTTETVGQPYYRSSTATHRYPTIAAAVRAKTNVAAALTALVEAYTAGVANFIGTETTTYG